MLIVLDSALIPLYLDVVDTDPGVDDTIAMLAGTISTVLPVLIVNNEQPASPCLARVGDIGVHRVFWYVVLLIP